MDDEDNPLLSIGYFRIARNVSRDSNHRIRVGACISRRKPLGFACNKATTHPRFANPDCSIVGSLHAEIRAIGKCRKVELKGTTIYVYRQYKNGTPALARPCSSCMSVLREKGIKFIYYTIGEYPYYRMERI